MSDACVTSAQLAADLAPAFEALAESSMVWALLSAAVGGLIVGFAMWARP